MGKAKTSWSNSVPDGSASDVNSAMASVVDHIVSHFSVITFEKTCSKYCLKGTYLLPECEGGDLTGFVTLHVFCFFWQQLDLLLWILNTLPSLLKTSSFCFGTLLFS